MTEDLIGRPEGTDGKAILGSDDKTSLNELEKKYKKKIIIASNPRSKLNKKLVYLIDKIINTNNNDD